MKKLFGLLLSLSLAVSMSATAFAATVADKNGTDSAEVRGRYVSGAEAQTVYSVDVAWGKMEFTYTDASKGIWKPETHTYDSPVPAKWSCDNGANNITVTNHSNAAVTANLAANLNAGFTGAFSEDGFTLPTAEGHGPSDAPSKAVTFTVTGGRPDTADFAKIGTLTVTIGGVK